MRADGRAVPGRDYVVRPAYLGNPSEHGFITRTWLGSYRLCAATRYVPDEVYYWHHHKLVEELGARDGAVWLVACDTQDASVLYAFCCAETAPTGPVVHYLFVKSRFRRNGIGTALVDEIARLCDQRAVIVATHMTQDGQRFRHALPVVFNPYVAHRKEARDADQRGDVRARGGAPEREGADPRNQADHP